MATVAAAHGSLAAGAVESDEGFLGIRQDHPARHHRAQRGREDGDDAELEDGEAPTDGALPHGDAAVEVRGTGDRHVGRAAVVVRLAPLDRDLRVCGLGVRRARGELDGYRCAPLSDADAEAARMVGVHDGVRTRPGDRGSGDPSPPPTGALDRDVRSALRVGEGR